MQGIRSEDRHHSDEQIREALAFGVSVLADEAIPPYLREKAFELAVNLRVAKSLTVEAVQPGIPTMAIPRGR